MKLAVNAANFSYCVRKKVGAVLVCGDAMVIGYNGTPPGFPNVCEDCDGETMPEVMHAESNALAKVMTSPLNAGGGIMYCTLSPCMNCAKLLVQARITRFVYIRDHSDQSGLILMRKCGIIVEQMEWDSQE